MHHCKHIHIEMLSQAKHKSRDSGQDDRRISGLVFVFCFEGPPLTDQY